VKYAREESEFEAIGLTEEWMANSKAPLVLESPVKYSMELKEFIPVSLYQTFF